MKEKVYIVKVNDSTESEAIEKAKQQLLEDKSLYASIYGYKRDGFKTVWLVRPIPCRSQEELSNKQDMLNRNKQSTNVLVYALYRHNVSDE